MISKTGIGKMNEICFRCPSNLEETHLEMLSLWLDPDDVIQDDDHDGGALLARPKRTVSDHFRPATAQSDAKKTAEGNCTYMTCAKLSIFYFIPIPQCHYRGRRLQ